MKADDGYMGDCPRFVCCPQGIASRPQQSHMQARLRMCHEQINERMKNYNCLVKRFVHGLDKHSSCFHAVAMITQIDLSRGDDLWSCSSMMRMTDGEVEHRFCVYINPFRHFITASRALKHSK